MKDLEYRNHITQEVGNLWALARALETEIIELEPRDGKSADHLDAAAALSCMMTDTLVTLRKYCLEH